ncbi:hypothetical protein [Falsiruegeria litorea]|uniref:hypothetical protein n=1 Tax=Falsiruegeria litorea TaxID=1280831 RepID=UPI001BFE18B5|nr:hypothetical protein [Falsiruegeria litorea]MBT8169781.1 hypothetical protein [Falsiruegeria litorea]
MGAISNDDFCADLKKRISAAYEKSGNTLGWRLLASRPAVLDGADVAFIGLNPGGSVRPDDHAEFAMDSGSAYVDETWGGANQPGRSPLQRQVRTLFEGLSVEPQNVLAGNLVPFRSPSWAQLKNTDFSLRFGELLWADILQRAQPTLVVGMGREVFKPLSRILSATDARSIPVGWGKVSAVKASFSRGSLVTLPHLSRFGIITRQESADALKILFGDHWQIQ